MLIQVKVHVYRLREKGDRLPGATIEERGPALGELHYRQRLIRSNCFCASLLAADGHSYVIPLLDRAVILEMTERGLLITGTEVIPKRHNTKSGAYGYRQGWWCVPCGK